MVCMRPVLLNTATLNALPWGGDVRAVLAVALDAVDPQPAVLRTLQQDSEIAEALAKSRRVLAVGAGKAAYPMALALEQALGSRLSGGLAVTKDGHIPSLNELNTIQIVEAGHPLPDGRGVQAARQMTGMLQGAGPDDLVFCLISGGGSALLTAPAPGISLADLQQLTALLLHCGAPIQRINGLRKHLELLKGGGLARLAAPARVMALILSDVVGDPLDTIASGPTVPDPSTFADAWGILQRPGLQDALPEGLRIYLQDGLAGKIPDTPKPQDPLFARAQTAIIASLPQAAQAAA